MKYRVLKPKFVKTGEKNENGQPIFRVEDWITLGTVQDKSTALCMKAAKRLHRTPVLEAVAE